MTTATEVSKRHYMTEKTVSRRVRTYSTTPSCFEGGELKIYEEPTSSIEGLMFNERFKAHLSKVISFLRERGDIVSNNARNAVMHRFGSLHLEGEQGWEMPAIDISIHNGLDLYWRNKNRHVTMFVPGDSEDSAHLYWVEEGQESKLVEADLGDIFKEARTLLNEWLAQTIDDA